MTTAFEAREVSVQTADGAALVADVDLAVQPGELLGVLGETGAGKTVTARAMLGLVPRGLCATGQVRFGSGEWLSLEQPRRVAGHLGREAGLMLQNPMGAFDPVQRIGPQLVEAVVRNGLMTKESATQRAAQLCQHLGLGDTEAIFKLYPHELSGGMSQRVALALTLMPRPQLVVVDEPTSALDANLRVDALRLLQSVARESDTAMVLISHDLGLVSRFCDRIAVLYAGHLAEQGPTATVLRRPAHPYTRALIGCSLDLARPKRVSLPTVGGEPPLPGNWPAGCFFQPRCPRAQDRCRDERPAPVATGGATVACHFPGEEA